MKAYKGFNQDMTCRGYQYEEGKSYTHDGNVKCCNSGFHACEYPLDCLGYYEPNKSVYHEVILDGEIDKEGRDDTKVSASKIKIGARLSIAGLVKAAIDFTFARAKKVKGTTTRKAQGAASSTGYQGAASAGNPTAVAVAWGRYGKAKGVKGAHIVLAEWGKWNGNEYPLIGAKIAQVDGEKIKENTYYTLRNGEFVEVAL